MNAERAELTTRHRYLERVIRIERSEEGFSFSYEDEHFLTAGTEFYPSRKQALQAAQEEIRREQEACKE
jgi:hypothetical protein